MWSRVDDNIPQHPKFVKAGAVASWLWICGNCYSNRYLTDGFIPAEVVPTLTQIPNIKTYADRLVRVGLWEIAPGGFTVHDFHDHNPHSSEVKAKRERDRVRKRIQDNSTRNPDGLHQESIWRANGIQEESARIPTLPARAIPVPVPVPVPSHPDPIPEQALIEKQHLLQKHLSSADADFERFRTAYPASRRVGGKTGKNAFKTAVTGRNGTHFESMLTALEQHKRSEQWQTPKLIPLMTTWLNQERWNQVLPETVRVSASGQSTFAAAQRVKAAIRTRSGL